MNATVPVAKLSDDILLLTEPVIMQPLRRRWHEVKAEIEQVLGTVILSKAKDPETSGTCKDATPFPAQTQPSTAYQLKSRQPRDRRHIQNDITIACWIRHTAGTACKRQTNWT